MSQAANRCSLVVGKDFRALQEERVRQYKILNDAHKVYLSTGPDYKIDPFQLVVTEVTEKFKTISESILALEKKAESDECKNKTLVNFIKKVQMLEEQKLHATVDLQLALQQAQDNPDDHLMRTNVRGIQGKLNEVMSSITETLEEVRYHMDDIQTELQAEEKS